MTAPTQTREAPTDWNSLYIEFIDRSPITLKELADDHGMKYDLLRRYASPDRGNWIKKRSDKFQQIREQNTQRMADILHQDARDKVQTFQALETRLERVVLASLELIFPPDDAPVEVHISAKRRLEAMSAKQLSTMISEGMRTLTETGRHRRLLSGQATAIFARAETPDVMLEIPLEDAKRLELRTRMAQVAMNSLESGEPLDIDYAVINLPDDPPATIRPESPDREDPPTNKDTPLPTAIPGHSPSVVRCHSMP